MKSKFYFLAVAVIMAAVFSGCKKDEPVAPTVVTKSASAVTKISATLKGEITNEGSDPITNCGFYYDSVPNMSYPMVIESKLNGTTFTASLTELNPGTTYYYRAYAISNAGTAEGEIVRFATVSAVAPTVLTVSVSAITVNSATLNGNITAEGSDPVTERGFIYGTSETNLSQRAECGTGTGTFNKALTGLSASTTYYFKAYATSDAGTSYGEVMSFATTAPTAPIVTTNDATNISGTGVTLNGNVTSDGGAMVTTRGFVYGTNQNNITQNITCGTGTGNMTYNLTGLTQGTRYYFKAYATNSAGTTYGEIKTFDTPGMINGHEYVDLGLPSGMRWATCNVGASSPEGYGTSCASGTSVTWGGNWRTPTKSDLQELIGTCSSEWTTMNNVDGRKFTGPNGKSIFLPARRNDYGYYLSSTEYTYGYSTYVYYLRFGSGSYCEITSTQNHSNYDYYIRPCCPR
ncbi:MAG: hypothetical protein IJK62_08935 [Bacteroidales bacterium]|nr:hypothetical protein [Bacteroidales bacterium]